MTSSELMKEHKFVEVIEGYYNSEDIVDIANVIYSYLLLERQNEAYDYYYFRKDYIEKEFPLYAIQLLLEIMLKINDLSLVAKEDKRLKNFPYINQEVEEVVQNFQKLYIEKKQFTESYASNETIMNGLQSNDITKLTGALIEITKEKDLIKEFLPYVYVAFENHENYDKCKMMLLFFLTTHHYDGEITIIRDHKYFFFNPKESSSEIENYFKKKDLIFEKYQKNEKNLNVIAVVKDYYLSIIYYQIPIIYEEIELNSILVWSIKEAYMNLGIKKEEFNILSNFDFREEFIENNQILFNKIINL